MISNFGFQSVYLFSKDYIDLAKRVEKTLPIWNSFNSLEILCRIEVERPFDVKYRNKLFKFKKGDKFQKVHVYRRRLEPWPEELTLSKWIFQEEVPGVHFIPGELLVDYFKSAFINELEIVLEKGFNTLKPEEIHLNASGQANRLLIIK